ncbi:hypothetical protein L2E82_40551 [Cichorium intybus]|uniref:Uncharacterized protein n=1 Tax=Cichorium intybus TaxID=13427 RepID=A0ACB9ALN0_CICIN|nr:hypothetical protein L2E82_40551 [Cichorium intybus]
MLWRYTNLISLSIVSRRLRSPKSLPFLSLSLSLLHEIDRISRLIVASVADSSFYRRRKTKRNLLDEHFKKLWWTIYASLYQER